jgi:hypothetical protein
LTNDAGTDGGPVPIPLSMASTLKRSFTWRRAVAEMHARPSFTRARSLAVETSALTRSSSVGSPSRET